MPGTLHGLPGSVGCSLGMWLWPFSENEVATRAIVLGTLQVQAALAFHALPVDASSSQASQRAGAASWTALSFKSQAPFKQKPCR